MVIEESPGDASSKRRCQWKSGEERCLDRVIRIGLTRPHAGGRLIVGIELGVPRAVLAVDERSGGQIPPVPVLRFIRRLACALLQCRRGGDGLAHHPVQTVPYDGNPAPIGGVHETIGLPTIDHGPIKKLDMDKMTMVFRVADPEMLKKVKAGDRIRFEADRVNGALTVTKLKKM